MHWSSAASFAPVGWIRYTRRVRGAVWILFLLALGCGDTLALRPVEIDLVGLSAQADQLTLLIAPPEDVGPCPQLDAARALAIPATRSWVWRRADDAPRTVTLEGLEEEALAFVAVAEDADGRLIQLACADWTFAELERPETTVDLHMSDI